MSDNSNKKFKVAVIGFIHPQVADRSCFLGIAHKHNCPYLAKDCPDKKLGDDLGDTNDARIKYLKQWVFNYRLNQLIVIDRAVDTPEQTAALISWLKSRGFGDIRVVCFEGPPGKGRTLNQASQIDDFERNSAEIKDLFMRSGGSIFEIERSRMLASEVNKAVASFVQTGNIVEIPLERKPVRGKSPLPIPSAMAFA